MMLHRVTALPSLLLVLLLPLLFTLHGCLIPIALEQQNPSDGGELLLVKGAMPAFGTQRAMTITDAFQYRVDVATDSANVAGRLYIQLNGTCCDLNPEMAGATRFLQQALVQAASENRYTVEFRQVVQPCLQGFAGSTVYIVPVIASGGFIDGPTGTKPAGFGEVDQSHYWTVTCP
jgi:hypothetical protein